jgi:ketosteroid isomerase-like protein
MAGSTPGDHRALIERFYAAFAARDHATMAACYHEDARFSDPVFPDLRGWKIGAMWRMLCERATDLEITPSNMSAESDRGKAHWDARYTYSATGRKVLNRIDAEFRFQDGLIIEHDDRFDLYRWTRMALGPVGVLLGWSPLVKNKVRRTAGGALDSFVKKNNLGAAS